MAIVMISATEGSVDRTVNCMCTPSDSANLQRTNASAPPRNTPGKINIQNKQIVLAISLSPPLLHQAHCQGLTCSSTQSIENPQFLFYPPYLVYDPFKWVNLRRHAPFLLALFFLAPLIEHTTNNIIIKTTPHITIILYTHPKVPLSCIFPSPTRATVQIKSETCRLHVKQLFIFFRSRDGSISLGSVCTMIPMNAG